MLLIELRPFRSGDRPQGTKGRPIQGGEGPRVQGGEGGKRGRTQGTKDRRIQGGKGQQRGDERMGKELQGETLRPSRIILRFYNHLFLCFKNQI